MAPISPQPGSHPARPSAKSTRSCRPDWNPGPHPLPQSSTNPKRDPPPSNSIAKNMPVLLTCDAIAKTYGSRTVFTDISLALHDGERLGIIGPNGAGKSTFLQVLAGTLQPGAGSIRKGVRLAMVVQDPVFDPASTVREIITASAIVSDHDDKDTEVSKII